MMKPHASPTPEAPAAAVALPRKREARRDQLRRGLEAILQQAGSGTRLRPERELAEQLGVARETLRRALDELQARGLLERRQGAGTFVSGQSWLKPLLLRSFTEDMRERGLLASSELLSHGVSRADAKVALRLKAVPGSEVFEVQRLRLASGEPMAIEHTFLPCARLPGFDPARLVSASLYEVLQREYGLVVRNAAQEIQATVLTEDEARLLDVAPFSPALLVERLVFATDGEPVEYGKSLYRADRYRFEVNVGRALTSPEGDAAAEGSASAP
jgi:GntR family transcriptional regulator